MSERPNDEQHRRAKRAAWLLATVVVAIYVGYIFWNFFRSAG